jgi:hypothetical protein
MKLDFDTVLFENPETESDVIFDLKHYCVNALINLSEEDKDITHTDKYDRYKFAQKIEVGGEVELTIEELAQLKELTGRFPSVVVVGKIFDKLEG